MPTVVALSLERSSRTLGVTFDDGSTFTLPAEYLRVESPSAEVQGHGLTGRKLVSGRAEVGIMAVEPVGHYGVRLLFDDLHDSGIFSWDYLHELGQTYASRWSRYLRALDEAGLSRRT